MLYLVPALLGVVIALQVITMIMMMKGNTEEGFTNKKKNDKKDNKKDDDENGYTESCRQLATKKGLTPKSDKWWADVNKCRIGRKWKPYTQAEIKEMNKK